MSVSECLWSLQKSGRRISFLLTALEASRFELKLIWSKEPIQSVRVFPNRDDAMAEAQRQLRTYVIQGWSVQSILQSEA